MSGFSSALKLTDLNDFIQPSQVCIKPAEVIKDDKNDNNDDDDDIIKINKPNKLRNRKIENEEKKEKEKPKLSPVTITLGDCLACSGCITSTEAILISEQSHEKVMNILMDKEKNNLIVVMSLSLQALASLAAKYNINSIQLCAERIAHLFYSLGVDYIFDITIARQICIEESWNELLEKYHHQTNKKQPLLSSTCPGFVCYAEKSQGNILVPLLSRIKSPQQIMGVLIKNRLHLIDNDNKLMNIKPEQIFHITLMPCYDKKLEASRLENYLDKSIPEVDCVITPLEVEKIIEFKQIDNFNALPCRQIDQLVNEFNADDKIQSHLGSGSGGYADNLLRMMAIYQKIAKEKFIDNKLEWNIVRNADFLEFNLYKQQKNNMDIDSEPLVSFAILNGFRNIQNLVSRLKRKSCSYDYIEVSACPKGCLNGGAQFRNISFNNELNENSTKDSDSILITYEQVEKLYDQLPKINFHLKDIENQQSKINNELYSKLQIDEQFRKKFQTKFQILEKKFNILNSNW